MKRPARIALLGEFGIGNIGNEASLAAMLTYFREHRPEADLVCVAHVPARVSVEHGVPSLPLRWSGGSVTAHLPPAVATQLTRLGDLVWAVRRARRFDVVVVPGTGILEEFWVRPGGIPYWLFCATLGARLWHRPVIWVSVGADEPEHPLTRWLVKTSVARSPFRSWRDHQSRDAVGAIGVDTVDDIVRPDLAFASPTPRRRVSGTGTVGLGVMAYYGRSDDPSAGADVHLAYLTAMHSFVSWLLDRGWQVRLLTGADPDEAVARAIERHVHDTLTELAGNVSVHPSGSIGELMRHMAATDVVVASRFHNLVGAIKLGIPTISISYARKNDDLMADVGLAAYCQPIEHIDHDTLVTQFRDLVERQAELSQQITARVGDYAHLLYEQTDRLDMVLKSLVRGAR